jgi:hypothetical protein
MVHRKFSRGVLDLVSSAEPQPRSGVSEQNQASDTIQP